MCILKALDQEQVDLNQNPKLKSQIYIQQRDQNRLLKMTKMLQKEQPAAPSGDIAEGDASGEQVSGATNIDTKS